MAEEAYQKEIFLEGCSWTPPNVASDGPFRRSSFSIFVTIITPICKFDGFDIFPISVYTELFLQFFTKES